MINAQTCYLGNGLRRPLWWGVALLLYLVIWPIRICKKQMLRRVVAELAAPLKAAKYSKQDLHYMFQPVAGEWWHVTFWPTWVEESPVFLAMMERLFLFQWISVFGDSVQFCYITVFCLCWGLVYLAFYIYFKIFCHLCFYKGLKIILIMLQ